MSSNPKTRRAKLIEALRNLTPVMRRRLAQLKSNAARDRKRKDLIWYLLLSSASTLGNARAYSRLFGDPRLADSISYAALAPLTASERKKRLLTTFRLAGVRYSRRKSLQLASNFLAIEERGGVTSETQRALALKGCERKRDYFRQFKGIGPKYANNVWMDIYDPDFRDCVAVDSRLKSILKELGSAPDIDEQRFFRQLACDACLQAWEVDRLLFWFTEYFIAAIRW